MFNACSWYVSIIKRTIRLVLPLLRNTQNYSRSVTAAHKMRLEKQSARGSITFTRHCLPVQPTKSDIVGMYHGIITEKTQIITDYFVVSRDLEFLFLGSSILIDSCTWFLNLSLVTWAWQLQEQWFLCHHCFISSLFYFHHKTTKSQ